jgi:hypothetical protein
MMTKSSNRLANWFAKKIWRHSVRINSSVDTDASIKEWMDENVGRYDVWIDYGYQVHTGSLNTIDHIVNKGKIEYRFRSVSIAVQFKLTFYDHITH